jgi:subtilase family serine protease
MLAFACSSKSATSYPPAVGLPEPSAGQITFYLSLPGEASALYQAASEAATPGLAQYRHFSSLANAAMNFGATNSEIDTVARSIKSIGLQFTADPTRLFGRVTGSAQQWQIALRTPLSTQPATSSNPFITYGLPARTPDALHPSGTALLLTQVLGYDPAAEGHRPFSGQRPATATSSSVAAQYTAFRPWPLDTGTPQEAMCSSPLLQYRQVYTEQQIQTAYGINALRAQATGTPIITVLDLGGGWLANDLTLAGQCFGYVAPTVTQSQGDGVSTAIANPDDETSLDLQTVAAVAPHAQIRLVQTTPNNLIDAFSRALSDSRGIPNVLSLSYDGCAYSENRGAHAYASVLDSILAMAALTGVSSFVAAGDAGSTTCGTAVSGTSLSYPAVSPFVTAVGGTRLTLGAGNTRLSEVVWNDSPYGANAATGGGVSRLEARPAYQNGTNPQSHRAIPDVSALADIQPGWPVVINSTLQTIGGTSGSTPLTAAATALVDASQQNAGHPPIGLANGWFYQAATEQPSAFFDVTQGNNDLAEVGCCQATVGYDPASGLGVPNWVALPATLPPSG